MATILVCDHCGGTTNVTQAEEFDLCGGCAVEVLRELAVMVGEVRDVVLAEIGRREFDGELARVHGAGVQAIRDTPPVAPTTPHPPAIVNPDAAAFAARSRLEEAYGTAIYSITPDVPVEPRMVISYGAERRRVEVLEPVPGAAGKWFARMAE